MKVVRVKRHRRNKDLEVVIVEGNLTAAAEAGMFSVGDDVDFIPNPNKETGLHLDGEVKLAVEFKNSDAHSSEEVQKISKQIDEGTFMSMHEED